ncbi:MAG: site-2 protease family protein [Alphaproteobacteria bacterium]|nr:site-2 protease family protein [Alphaproteobacteria bacterium]
MGQIIEAISVWALPLLLAITLHEAAHGFAAYVFGDDTARRLGRMSLNPIRHIDPFGTVLMPALLLLAKAPFLFGYAKPVPVNFGRLNRPRRDMVWVALAGPGMNMALAVLAALLYHGIGLLPSGVEEWAAANLRNTVYINVLLAVFNMLPIPPLDGGRVAVGLLPDRLAFPLARLERTGIFLVLGLLFLLPMVGDLLGFDLNLFGWLIGRPTMAVIDLIAALTGHGS